MREYRLAVATAFATLALTVIGGLVEPAARGLAGAARPAPVEGRP